MVDTIFSQLDIYLQAVTIALRSASPYVAVTFVQSLSLSLLISCLFHLLGYLNFFKLFSLSLFTPSKISNHSFIISLPIPHSFCTYLPYPYFYFTPSWLSSSFFFLLFSDHTLLFLLYHFHTSFGLLLYYLLLKYNLNRNYKATEESLHQTNHLQQTIPHNPWF